MTTGIRQPRYCDCRPLTRNVRNRTDGGHKLPFNGVGGIVPATVATIPARHAAQGMHPFSPLNNLSKTVSWLSCRKRSARAFFPTSNWCR